MKQTIIALALSAAFCYSSYALSEGLTPTDAVDIFEADFSAVDSYCKVQEDVTYNACVASIYRGAANVLIEAAYQLGYDAADCATKSREILTF